MTKWNVVIGSRVSFSTDVEAETESEAIEKAMDEWEDCDDCDIGDMEFWDTKVADVWKEDED